MNSNAKSIVITASAIIAGYLMGLTTALLTQPMQQPSAKKAAAMSQLL